MTHERGLPPQPVFSSLPSAIRAAQAHGTTASDIKPDRWASTYATSAEKVMQVWQQIEWERTQQPQNDFADGK
jgi:hypothetical protein